MGFKFSDIEFAYLYANASPDFSQQAIICKETGEIYYASEYGDGDEIPDEVYESDTCIEIPRQNDLDLGKHLVFEFVDEYIPEMYERVRRIFSSRGAYARYKDLLDDKGLLQQWHEFEDERQIKALRKWCADNEIDLDD